MLQSRDENRVVKEKKMNLFLQSSFPLFHPLFLLSLFSRVCYFFFLSFYFPVPFLPVRLNACLQLHLVWMRGNWVGDLVGFVSLEITSVWEVTKVA